MSAAKKNEVIAELINSWMPPGCKVTAAHVDLALRGEAATVTVNIALLRDKIDRSPVLYSARLNGDLPCAAASRPSFSPRARMTLSCSTAALFPPAIISLS